MKWIGLLMALCAPLVLAQSEVKPAAAADPLAPIAWMAGGTWHGEAQSPDGGAPVKIDTKIRRVLGGRAMTFETNFNGVQRYQGQFAYDALRRKIVFTYSAADGGWIEGTVEPQPEYLNWDFEVHEADGTSGHYQVHVHQDGADDYTWALFQQQSSSWAPLFALKYHRVAD